MTVLYNFIAIDGDVKLICLYSKTTPSTWRTPYGLGTYVVMITQFLSGPIDELLPS